ncbi:MAG: hypothetical protein WBP93_16075 [Pyrinomonadaceae bacterium]
MIRISYNSLMRTGKLTDRELAVRRGVDFLYSFACNPENFAECGSDLTYWFHFIATRDKNAELRRVARKMGKERARQWRLDNPKIPADADAETIYDLIFGNDTADRLGLPDNKIKERLRRAALKFPVSDYLSFDPAVEPPPRDVPEQCKCGLWNKRGRKVCRRCKKRLKMMTRYAVWYDALIRTYIATCYGVSLGASYSETLKWLPVMRPYRASGKPSHPEFYDTVYAITHVVYTLNDYDKYRLSPEWLPQEFSFLKANLKEAIALDDPEMVGEIVDTLKSFGMEDDHRLIHAAMKYLLSKQNADGTWGDTDAEDVYANYHATLCAAGGLMNCVWHGERLSLPKLKRWLIALPR